MAVRGKNISVYLMDGDATGRMKATIANWTGVAYRIPRTALDLCKDRDDLKQSGVYFLFGVDDQSGDNVVYIGQAGARKNGEGILNRLAEHKRNPDKDYWTEAVVFTTSNNSFGPTEISYLENRFCGMAQSAKRYTVKNGNDPTHGNITEEKESELEEFVDFDTFSKSDFRAVKVKACEAVKKSKKLLQFTLDDGTGTDRTILSGIHAYYEPEELVGKTLIAITNLPPRAMMGIESCGMLLSAIHEEEGEEKLHLLMVDNHIPAGAKLY